MMHHHITVVLAGAAAHFATGWALNSEMLLGKFFKKNKAKPVAMHKDMRVNLAAQLVASIALSVATCVVICMISKTATPTTATDALSRFASMFFNQASSPKNLMCSLRTIIFIWAGFIVPSSACEVIWCGHNLKNWLVEMGMDLAGLIAITLTITYLI